MNDDGGERLRHLDYQISDLCLQNGITWHWFPENWSFGNGVTTHKTLASPEYKTVVHGTDLSMDEFLANLDGPLRPGDVLIERKHMLTEGWAKYEARWVPGTCPQENHVVHLTWLVTTHQLNNWAYNRIRKLIEGGATPRNLDLYSTEPGKHFSEIKRYDGKPAYGGMHALPMS